MAVRLSPFYTAMANSALAGTSAGANGLVLFNRFYQPDVDLENMTAAPRVSLSSSADLGLPLRWAAILRPFLAEDVSLGLTSGVHTGSDAAKAVAVGADVVMTASELLARGPGRVEALESELREWLAGHGYRSVSDLRGSLSVASVDNPEAFERANYTKTLRLWRFAGAEPAGAGRSLANRGGARPPEHHRFRRCQFAHPAISMATSGSRDGGRRRRTYLAVSGSCSPMKELRRCQRSTPGATPILLLPRAVDAIWDGRAVASVQVNGPGDAEPGVGLAD